MASDYITRNGLTLEACDDAGTFLTIRPEVDPAYEEVIEIEVPDNFTALLTRADTLRVAAHLVYMALSPALRKRG